MNIPGFDEDFLEFESKVNQVMKILEDVSNANKKEGEEVKKPAAKVVDEPNINDFIITVKDDRTFINKKPTDKTNEAGGSDETEMDKFTFMQQIEKDAEERSKVKKERERIAQNFRNLGNEAFRKQNYEKAINMYTKAIEHIKDSPILYNNRALSYMKLKNYKRAIIDCDYVINKLEEKNLRSWLYRAAAYKRSNDEKNYVASVKLARKNNPKKSQQINEFLDKFAREQF